jgi:hypothetical protein
VVSRLLARGFKVLQPCGFNHRYDLVLDLDDGIYAVPVADASRGEMCLRVAQTGNGQATGIRWASEYVLPA